MLFNRGLNTFIQDIVKYTDLEEVLCLLNKSITYLYTGYCRIYCCRSVFMPLNKGITHLYTGNCRIY
jgi:hypothetical protein